jgi:hypothetical protein
MLAELLRKSPTWLLAAAVLLLLLQSEGVVGHVFGGGPPPQSDAQHAEQIRQLSEANKKLDALTDQLRANGNTTAVGLRILCLQGAKTDQQRADCARIQ